MVCLQDVLGGQDPCNYPLCWPLYAKPEISITLLLHHVSILFRLTLIVSMEKFSVLIKYICGLSHMLSFLSLIPFALSVVSNSLWQKRGATKAANGH